MQIGILGAGFIGTILTQRLSAAGHDVVVANSRGPETIPAEVFANGGRAAEAHEVVAGVDVLIVSIPFVKVPDLKSVLSGLPADATILDTSNYYPRRDGSIRAVEEGLPESVWVSEEYGRPVAKAWNSITWQSFASKNAPKGAPDRIALPVSADSQSDLDLAIALVEETGFDGYDAGGLADSWRQQPGAPAYCTDLTLAELPDALAAARAGRSPRRRELAWDVIAELTNDYATPPTGDLLVRLNRLLYLPQGRAGD
jgi:predicted dinucleotide-binding enzyme